MKNNSNSSQMLLLKRSTATLLSIQMLFGCATLPVTGTPATGERLSVQEHNQSYTYTTKEAVGEVQHQDSNGRNAGTSTMYRNVTRTGNVRTWKTYQGDAPVDEFDFFSIAREMETARKIDEHRKTALTVNRVGWVALGVGALAILGGLAVNAQAANQSSNNYSPTNEPNPLVTGLLGGGLAVGLGGYYAAAYGDAVLGPTYHNVTEEEARRAADAYNRSLEQPVRETAPVPTTRTPARRPQSRR